MSTLRGIFNVSLCFSTQAEISSIQENRDRLSDSTTGKDGKPGYPSFVRVSIKRAEAGHALCVRS